MVSRKDTGTKKGTREMINFREIISIFPTIIGKSIIENKKLIEKTKIDVLQIAEQLINKTEINFHTWTTKDNLNKLPQFRKLKKVIDVEVKKYLLEVHGMNPEHVCMINMWSNIQSEKPNKHHIHIHRNAFLSGVLYISVPKNSGSIFFTNPTLGHFIADTTHESNVFHGIHTIEPIEGMMLLFFSNLPHGTNNSTINKNEYRISISFNYALLENNNYNTGNFKLKEIL